MKHEFNNFSMFKFDINPHANYQSLYSIKKYIFSKTLTSAVRVLIRPVVPFSSLIESWQLVASCETLEHCPGNCRHGKAATSAACQKGHAVAEAFVTVRPMLCGVHTVQSQLIKLVGFRFKPKKLEI